MRYEDLKAQESQHSFDHFPTPPALADAACLKLAKRFLHNPHSMDVLDAGCGSGVWGQAVRPKLENPFITGIDIRPVPLPDSYNRIVQGDFLNFELSAPAHYNLIVGNPPFNQIEDFIIHGWSLLVDNGVMMFLGRIGLLAGQGRGKGLWLNYPPMHVAVCSARPSFTGDGTSDIRTDYAVYYWRKSYLLRGITPEPTISWLDWR